MTDNTSALDVYDALLASVGRHAAGIGPGRVASHWPHVGRNYRGLVIAGQALQGWDQAVSGSRWYAVDAVTPDGRRAIIQRTQTWFEDAADPVGVIATLGNRRRSPFWTLCRDVAEALEPDGGGAWYSRFAWANVYPVGPDDPPGSPSGSLKEAQDPLVGALFAGLLDTLDAHRVVVIAGPAYWWHASRHPAFANLEKQPFPLIWGGRVDGRTVVVGYHPTYARRRHIGAAGYASAVLAASRAIEAEK